MKDQRKIFSRFVPRSRTDRVQKSRQDEKSVSCGNGPFLFKHIHMHGSVIDNRYFNGGLLVPIHKAFIVFA